MVAIARLTDVRFVPQFSIRTIVLWLTFVAVYSFGIVQAVLANSASLIAPMDVQRLASHIHFLGKDTFVRMAVAVARFALERTLLGILSPLLLLESFAAFFALNTARVMLARAREKARIVVSAAARIQCTGAGMSVTHAAASD